MSKRKKQFPDGDTSELPDDFGDGDLDGDQNDTPDPELAPALPDPIPESPPAPALPRISLKVFERVAGPKWDQLAGFKRHAKTLGLGPLTIPEWRDALLAFKNKPTK